MAVTSPAAPAVATTPKKLGWRQYSGYATGDAANNLAFAMASSFLLLYYTNVVGLGGAAIGTMFLLIRFWDAFADLFAGRMVDGKKPGRFGKFRPFIMWFSLPLLLSSMAIFSTKTFFPNISESQALIYAYVSYAVMGTLYSLVNIPYGSIAPAMTQVPTERAKLASWRVWGSNITILMLSFVVAPQIKKYAKDPDGPAAVPVHHHRDLRGPGHGPVPVDRDERQGAGPARRGRPQHQGELRHPARTTSRCCGCAWAAWRS